MKKFIPIIISLVSLVLFGIVVYFTRPPKSWEDASILQIVSIFIPFLSFFISLTFAILRSVPRALTIGVGITLFIALQASSQLNIFSAIIVLVLAVGGLFIYEKFHQRYYLTEDIKIPKLTKLGGKKK